MGTDRSTIGFEASGDLAEEFETYKDERGYDTKSDAARDIFKIGLREANGPLLYRAKDTAIDAAYHLLLVAAVIAIAGITTDLLATADAFEVAAVIATVAVGSLALVELARTVTGRTELAAGLRERWSL